MIRLPWQEEPIINEALLRKHVSEMQKQSLRDNVFVILLPIVIYEYIKNVGINAEIEALWKIKNVPYDTVWVKIQK